MFYKMCAVLWIANIFPGENSPSARHEGGLRLQLGVLMMSRLGHGIPLFPLDLTLGRWMWIETDGPLTSH